MADRKKDKKAAIDFSVETSTPAVAAPKVSKPKVVKPIASPALPGLRKAQAEAAVKPHKRAAADKVKRQDEISKGIQEGRMPGQNEAEERWKAGRADLTKARANLEEKTRYQAWLHNNTATSPEEEASAKELRRKGAKKPRGGRGAR